MKKILAFVLCMMLLVSLAAPVGAARSGSLAYGSYYVDDASVVIPGIALPGVPEIEVSSEGEVIENVLVSTIREEELPVTYICVMDLSSSWSLVQINQQKAVLKAINERMRPSDRMIIVKVGETVGDALTYLNTSESRIAAIDGGDGRKYHTCVYEGVVKVMKLADQQASEPGTVCVVFVSDGVNDTDGYSEEDARRAVRNSNVPFFPVVTLDTWYGPQSESDGKKLASFADESVGGKSFNPTIDKVEADSVGKQIVDAMLNSSAIMVDASRLSRSYEEVEIDLTCTAGGKSYVDSVTVKVEDIAHVPAYVAETTAPTEFAIWTEAGAQTGMKFDLNLSPAVLMIAGCVVLILILVAVLIMVIRRKNFVDEYADLVFMDESKDYTPGRRKIQLNNIVIPDEEGVPGWVEPTPAPKKAPAPAAAPKKEMKRPSAISEEAAPAADSGEAKPCRVRLVSALNKESAITFSMQIDAVRSFGRTKRANIVLNEDDEGLSGLHFELQWDGNTLKLRDRNSTNGTSVNKVAAKANTWVPVKHGDTIQAGSFEYKVLIAKA